MNFNEIINNGYCIGCGACALADSSVKIKFDQYGCYTAVPSDSEIREEDAVLDACPFSDAGQNETEIAAALFGKDLPFDSRLGFYGDLYAGYVAEGRYRELGTSGGIITWLCCELLEKGAVDGILHVKKNAAAPLDGAPIFTYGISKTVEEVCEGTKSRYYPVEMSGVLQMVKENPGQYVLVGLPCFIKAARRLMVADEVLRKRIRFCVGLVCGHLKSKAFAECFGWQKGMGPGKLENVDFRVKLPDHSAGDYGVLLSGGGCSSLQRTRELYGYNWGHNFFRYPACNACDDVFAETADVVVGDAWIDKYIEDPKGTSVVVVRNQDLRNIFRQAVAEDRLRLNVEDADTLADSQAGGLRDRREGLAYRLHLWRKMKRPVPVKRVDPQKHHISPTRRAVYRMRIKMEAASHEYWRLAVARNDYQFFKRRMDRLLLRNKLLLANLSRLFVEKSRSALRKARNLVGRRMP